MLGGIHRKLLVTVTLLFLTETGTRCRAENHFPSVSLPDWRTNSEYVTQCFSNSSLCDWTWNPLRVSATEKVAIEVLESGPLGLEGEACLEFWYLAPITAKGSELRTLLRSSTGLEEIWTSPAIPRDFWRQVFVPLNIIEPRTQVVFQVAAEVSVEERVTFDRIGVRRGSCGEQCESGTERWTDMSPLCHCSFGQLLCSPTQCPQGQICGPQRGGSSEISASGACTIHSNTDCSTFDGLLFRFMAPCTFTLARTCSSTEAMPAFTVELVAEEDGNSSLPIIQEVLVEIPNFRVSLRKRETKRVVVNGVWRKLPLKLSDTVNLRSNPAAVILETTFGLYVSYDIIGSVNIKLPPNYSDKVCGLCGNFNHLREDDFRKPDGSQAHDATSLVESWQSRQPISFCETILVPHQCDPLEEAEYASERYCGGLISSTGTFAECLLVLEAQSYFRGCVDGMCSSHGDLAVLCDSLQVFAYICQEAGVAIHTWRNSTLCPFQCGENSHYNPCADGCPDVCTSMDATGSCGSCVERCECDSGFKLSGEKCVPAEDCGCWYQGELYEKGESWLQGECVQQCQCIGSGIVQCTTMQCPETEICKVKDGLKGCFPLNITTCRVYGDPHYITFDEMVYDFQGGCSYTLTTTCGEGSSIQFTVIGHNMHPPLQNLTRSKLEAVTLQIDDLNLTLNESREINVNGSIIQLPYSNKGPYGSVWVYVKGSYIILETTFGLRMKMDGQNRLFLQVDERYKNELCGLCGTFSGYQDDDFVMPGGQNATGSFEFGDSWRVQDNNECVAIPNDPTLCDSDDMNEAYQKCNTLLWDAFKPCHELVHPTLYISSCVYDYCATNSDQHTLCESLKSYVAACQVAGVELQHWQTDTACADLPTTSAPSTTPTPTSPTPDQTYCPINCDFERNLCGWEQLVQDSFDWTKHSGPTPSNSTGPTQDHTTGAGFYIYIEGNSVTHGDSARLLSSVCHYTGPLCVQFWYHMYGSAKAMALNIYMLKDNSATKIWAMQNNQGPKWHPQYVDIGVPGPFQIIVEGIRGSNVQSDVAIDDISIQFGSCSDNIHDRVKGTELRSTTAGELPSHPVCQLDCSFEQDLCKWNNLLTDVFDWTRLRGSTSTVMTGPSSDHTSGDGYYLYIEGNSGTHGDTARLLSSECSDSGPQCLQFWYHMYGSADTMGLNVYLLQNRLANSLWLKRNNQGNTWQLAEVDFTTTGAFQIIFEGRRGSTEKSDVSIDDVKLFSGRCSDVSGAVTRPPRPEGNSTAPPTVHVPTITAPEHPLVNVTVQLPDTSHLPVENVTLPPVVEATTYFIDKDNSTEVPDKIPPPHKVCQLDCSFEQDLCKWNNLLTDVFDWTRLRGSTSTVMTGPSSDHTSGDGYYLYIEGNSGTHGDTARLLSSECSDSGPQCLQFWYHMYGSADTMGLNVYLLQNRLANSLWLKRNNQGNTWQLAEVDFTTTGAFQIIFEGRRGSTEESDVSIDDVKLFSGRCSDVSGAVTRPPRPEGNTTAPPTVHVPTITAPEHPLVNVTVQLPHTSHLPVANVTLPPVVEATTYFIDKDNSTEVPDKTPPPHKVCQLDCSFEQDLCKWNNLLTDVFDWTRLRGSTSTVMTGPSSDHTSGDGYYLYIEGNSGTHGDTARLLSSECSDSGPQCLQFWYHMYGSADTMGLNVYLLQNKLANSIWLKRNNQGNTWQLAEVDFTTTGAFQIIFEGRRGSTEESDVSIDDVKLFSGRCSDVSGAVTRPPRPEGNTTAPPTVHVPTITAPEHPLVNVTVQLPDTSHLPVANVTLPPVVEATTYFIDKDNSTEVPDKTPPPHKVCQLDCSFEQDLCKWNNLLTDVFDWTRLRGSTSTVMTGPSSDHTSGDGYYLYIEGNSGTHGDTARLLSSECSDSGPQCLQFWYHMYGSADTMGLNVYLLQNKLANSIWLKRNNQGNTWQLAEVDFTTTGAFQIIFEGRRGSTEESDVSIDDVKLFSGRCSDISGAVTRPPRPEGNTTASPTVHVPTITAPEHPLVNVTVQLPDTSHLPVANVTLPPVVEATTYFIDKDNSTEVPDKIPPPHKVCQLDCSFEQDLCKWNNLLTDVFDWTRLRGSTSTVMTGPSSDHTSGDGYYLYIEGNSGTHGDTARLLSSECSDSGPQCLQFWYHMYGSADTMGLNVYLLQNRLANSLWLKRNNQGNTWQLAEVDFTTTGAFQIIFEGRRGSNEESDVSIDDVKLFSGRCSDISGAVTRPPRPEGNSTAPPTVHVPTITAPEHPLVNVTVQLPDTSHLPVANVTLPPVVEATTYFIDNDNSTEVPDKIPPPHKVCQLDCSFEQDLCKWNNLLTDVFDWTRLRGSTSTVMTGPSSDHTSGDGYYLYIEGNSGTHGDTARLLSSECSDSGPQCLKFWYHMYGSADTMGLNVYLLQNKLANSLWLKRNNQGNTWQLAEVDFTTTGAFQIIFEGRRGSNDQSDVAIDDVSLHRGHCEDLVKPTILPSTTFSVVSTEGQQTSASSETLPPTPFTTIALTTTTAAPDCDTQTPTIPTTALITEDFNPDVLTSKPLIPATTRPTSGPETAVTQPVTTTESPSTAVPKPQTSVKPQDTSALPQSTTNEPQSQTTIKPQHTSALTQSTTAGPGLTTAIQPHSTTIRPQSTTTAILPSTTTVGPQTSLTSPSCPQNSHYNSCISACNPTCTHIHGPPHCKDSAGCVQGCVCNVDFVQKGRVCVPIQQCACLDRNGAIRQFNEVWYTNHCSQKCECKERHGSGKIDCDDKDECDGNAVCLQNEEGNYYCQSTGLSDCTINSDAEYRTFDKLRYDFEGEHSYVLVQSRNLPDNLPDVYIEVKTRTGEGNDDDDSKHHDDSSSEEDHSRRASDENEDDDSDSHDEESEEHEENHRFQELRIRVYNHTVELLKKRMLVVDGRRTNTPVSPSPGVNIYERFSRIYLKTDFGLSVEFDGHSTAEIILPRIYRRKVGGLCGNFDSQKKNDWMKPDGTRARSAEEFGESWRV